MHTLSINVPVGGKVIITRPTPKGNPEQQELFGGSFKDRWIADMVNFIRTFPRPLVMSTVRIEAAKRGMSSPAHKNWYGGAMRAAGLRGTNRVQISPIKSRNSGTERVWE